MIPFLFFVLLLFPGVLLLCHDGFFLLLLLLEKLLLLFLSILESLVPVRFLEDVPDIAKIMPSMCRSPMDKHPIQFEAVLLLAFLHQVPKVLLQVEGQEVRKLHSVKPLEIKSKASQREHEDIGQRF